MRVSIRPQRPTLDDAFRAYLAQHLGCAFSRLGERVARVSIRVGAVPGVPQDALGSRCYVNVRLRQTGRVVVEHSDADPRVAVARCLARAEHAVEHALDCSATFDARPLRLVGGVH